MKLRSFLGGLPSTLLHVFPLLSALTSTCIKSLLVPSWRAQTAPAPKACGARHHPALSLCCLCTDTRTHQGSLQPQSYCARQSRTLPVARRAWDWERRTPGSEHNCARPSWSQPPVSLGNGHSKQDQGSGQPGGQRAARGLLCGPARIAPFDHLRFAFRPQPGPRPEGAPLPRLWAPARLRDSLQTPGPGPAAPGPLLPAAPPVAPPRELSREPPRPARPGHTPIRPPARSQLGLPLPRPPARPQALRLPTSPSLPEEPHSAAAARRSRRASSNLAPRSPPG